MDGILTEQEVLSLLPNRGKETSKHDYGKLLAVCGSTYYRGAASLSCGGALRCGVGILTLASIEKVVACVASSRPECTFLPLAESENGTVAASNSRKIIKDSAKYKTMLIGCGLAIDGDTRSLVKTVVPEVGCQLVIDADGLNIISECPEILKQTKKPAVITPHFGEMARLCGKTREEVAEAPLVTAMRFAEEYNCTVVLKSHITYIATPEGAVAINSQKGNSGLAKGGSGDVLAGMIASFCAQGLDPFCAAKCGVYLHADAADKCAEQLSERAMLPGDLINYICK